MVQNNTMATEDRLVKPYETEGRSQGTLSTDAASRNDEALQERANDVYVDKWQQSLYASSVSVDLVEALSFFGKGDGGKSSSGVGYAVVAAWLEHEAVVRGDWVKSLSSGRSLARAYLSDMPCRAGFAPGLMLCVF